MFSKTDIFLNSESLWGDAERLVRDCLALQLLMCRVRFRLSILIPQWGQGLSRFPDFFSTVNKEWWGEISVRWNISEMKYPWDEISVRWNICEEKYRSEVLTNSIWAVLALFTCLLIESALDKYAYMRVPVKARPQNRYMSITIFVLAVVLDAAYCSLISLTTLRRCIRWALVCNRLSVNTLCMT